MLSIVFNCQKLSKLSKIVKDCQKLTKIVKKMSKIVKIVKNYPKLSTLSKQIVKINVKEFKNVGGVMFPHYSKR